MDMPYYGGNLHLLSTFALDLCERGLYINHSLWATNSSKWVQMNNSRTEQATVQFMVCLNDTFTVFVYTV